MNEAVARALEPLPYHVAVVRHLREVEPEVWQWASSVRAQQDHADHVREQLLRHTYRLGEQSHGAAHAAVTLAAQRLGLTVPITLYQGSDGAMNASLYFLADEAHIVLTGPVLEKLSEPELLALFGHELAHHVLWTCENGAYHAADRILQQCAHEPSASTAHIQTARLFALYTEIYADRGAALAAQSADPAISTLVKTHTGLASVDPQAYLQQALELDARNKQPSPQQTHPESFLRAQAVHLWWQQDESVHIWAFNRIEGGLTMQRLDMLGQQRLRALSRGLIAHLLRTPGLDSERARTQVRAYFPDWSEQERPLDGAELRPEALDDSVRDYLCAVLLDFALVDPDIRDDALPHAGRVAGALGLERQLAAALRKHLGMTKRAVDKLAKQWPTQPG
ncbi:M48 family metalloprotease [Nevskia soli]|uniref:M48 family metalloprotease n=1 Tax=Nevskia soli TaxID=418856 RepID=UPI0004A76CA7|nr:M48 family metalloprotease [Nevskia soli]